MRLATGLVGRALAAILLGQAPAASGGGTAYDPQVTVRYVGTFASFTYTASSTDGRFFSPKTEQWTWSYVWEGKLSVLHLRRPSRFTTESLSGTVRRIDEAPVGGGGSCLITYRAKRGAYALRHAVLVPFKGGQYVWKQGTAEFNQLPPVHPANVVAVRRSGAVANGHCTLIGPPAHMRFPPSLGSVFRFVGLDKISLRTRGFNRRVKPLGGGRPKEHFTLRSSVTFQIRR
jgi:hypothetical protein